MGNYISSNMTQGNKLVGILEINKDVRATYGTNHMPKYLSIEDKKSEVNIYIQNQCIKMYVMKEMEMVNNIDSIHAKIWWKCTKPLQNIINHLDQFTMKHKDKDVIWIFKNLNTVSTDIEFLGNKLVDYFNYLRYF